MRGSAVVMPSTAVVPAVAGAAFSRDGVSLTSGCCRSGPCPRPQGLGVSQRLFLKSESVSVRPAVGSAALKPRSRLSAASSDLREVQDQERFVAPYGRPESLLFVSPKRSNQEKGDPMFVHRLLCKRCALRYSPSAGRRELGHPWPRTCAPCSRGWLRCSARTTGFHAWKGCRADLHSLRDHAWSERGVRSCRLCGQDGRSMGPLPVGGRLEDQPAGTRARCARVFRQHRDVLSKNPASRTRTRRAGCPESDWPGWPFSWLLLFGHSKRSDSGRPKGGLKCSCS